MKINTLTKVCCALIIWCFFSCNSKLSTQPVTNISLIGAKIDILQLPEDKQLNEVLVELFDSEGKSIRNEGLIIYINGDSLTLQKRQGLYYTDESRYLERDVPVKDSYVIEIQLSDGKKYPLGTINVLKQIEEKNIIVDKKGDLTKDFVVKWNNIEQVSELSVRQSIILSGFPANEENMASRNEIIIPTYGFGIYTLNHHNFSDSEGVLDLVELEFRAFKMGKTSPILLAGSEIKIHSELKKVIFFK
ncbi:hypothetical protein EZJ43_01880 [Pedobacter changchengzhani]|uniref:DUF4249 family protein n=1 Tax=Pedobacter changchengzhani TaxID=2529274 RepID=A0A4R5MPZ1_9SPHI|nr:hypothetical protein [Pedobacter changchengzhani]TDG37864.1 hypothetical protein EZJ43_01880 [Pedobacter changchengzhani]